MTILGVDPSADISGVVLVSFDEHGKSSLQRTNTIDLTEIQKREAKEQGLKWATADAATAYRLYQLRLYLRAAVHDLADAFDALAYEYPQVINAAWGLRQSTIDVHRAGGAVLASYAWPDVLPVGTITARNIYAPGKALPTDKKKEACLLWAAARYGADWSRLTYLCSRLEQEAIADACAVAEAGYKQYLKRAQLCVRDKPARKKATKD